VHQDIKILWSGGMVGLREEEEGQEKASNVTDVKGKKVEN